MSKVECGYFSFPALIEMAKPHIITFLFHQSSAELIEPPLFSSLYVKGIHAVLLSSTFPLLASSLPACP